MRKTKYLILIFLIFSAVFIFASEATGEKGEKVQQDKTLEEAGKSSFKYLSASIAVGIACIAGGFAVGKIGAAAMGAMSEKPEVSGKAIPFVGLAEGICLWGFLVALLILLL